MRADHATQNTHKWILVFVTFLIQLSVRAQQSPKYRFCLTWDKPKFIVCVIYQPEVRSGKQKAAMQQRHAVFFRFRLFETSASEFAARSHNLFHNIWTLWKTLGTANQRTLLLVLRQRQSHRCGLSLILRAMVRLMFSSALSVRGKSMVHYTAKCSASCCLKTRGETHVVAWMLNLTTSSLADERVAACAFFRKWSLEMVSVVTSLNRRVSSSALVWYMSRGSRNERNMIWIVGHEVDHARGKSASKAHPLAGLVLVNLQNRLSRKELEWILGFVASDHSIIYQN